MGHPIHTFSAETYILRRKALFEKMGDALILFPGHGNSPINYLDNYYPFRQDSNFLYYAGLNMPDMACVMDGANQTTTLFGNDIDIEHVVWMGAQPSMKELGEKVGIQHTLPYQSLFNTIQQAVDQGRKIHYLPPYRMASKVLLHQLTGYPLDHIEEKVSLALVNAVIAQREIKEAQEIQEMEKAVTVSGALHHAVMAGAKSGMKESEIVGLIQSIAAKHDCQLAYTPIITINGQTLHNHSYHNHLQEGQLLLGDFGAANPFQYAGDITRTIPVSKTFTTQQKEIYQLVLDAENNAINSVKPGINYRDVHLGAAHDIAEGLKALGIMKGEVQEAVNAGAHALFFPHGLGHMIGLDVHDMEDLGEDYVGYGNDFQRSTQFGLKYLRLAKELKAGMALTVEPGIYFIPELIDQWQAAGKFKDFINFEALGQYRNFGGIRIEDDVLVTTDGVRVLGEPIAKSIEVIEQLSL